MQGYVTDDIYGLAGISDCGYMGMQGYLIEDIGTSKDI
jgi:hypothetical protein